ncbi:E2F transcription factor-like E2FE [Quillaja saponaria]|uniref:E2F transcription factor-like E2FE n=1 Tax=Quillaja saponaria TaxID=32244 RepID=A0AAD7PXC6_QUISA|nr:E2F transcription factor-like E2FE [Quillaja saponaria]
MSLFVSQESEPRPPIYSRKEKSLGVLCSNFLKLYNREGVGTIGLDDAASRLGVERRRMYDVVNILESVGIIARKAKNQYSWKGFKEIPRALKELKVNEIYVSYILFWFEFGTLTLCLFLSSIQEEGLREKFKVSAYCSSAKVLNENENGGSSSLGIDCEDNSLSSSKIDSRRDKSLALLTENFIKLFLCSDVDIILLEDAARALPGDANNSTALRTKVRRLYDIANVFASINLIEKTNHPEGRKTACRWLGWRGKPDTGSDGTLELNGSKRRVFGAELTNYNLKRNKGDFVKSNQKEYIPVHTERDNLKNEDNGKMLEELPRKRSKGIVFGPFAPVVHRREDRQALSDLFAHYTEAWKSWFTKAAGQRKINPEHLDHANLT